MSAESTPGAAAVTAKDRPGAAATRADESAAPTEPRAAPGGGQAAPLASASGQRAAPTESIFVRVAEDRFEPTEHARGPWDPRALHGGAPAALIAAVLEHIEPGAELPFARLHFEFLRPVPLAPLRLSTRVTRPGRRVQALEAELRTDDAGSGTGELVCRAQALRIQPVPGDLPPRAGVVVRECAPSPLPTPAEGHPVRFALDDPQRRSFAGSATEMRFVHGHPLKGALPDDPDGYEPVGAAAVWMRLRHPLLPGESTSALARVPAAADFGNGVAAVVPFDAYLFINADLSIELDRRPQGEWIGLDAHTLLHPDGIGWAQSVLHDERGPLGRARQTLVVQPR